MNNKKINTNTTMETRVISCIGSINFIDHSHSELPTLINELENKLKNTSFIENYYLIYHNETNTPHIHFALEFTGQKRLKTVLNDFERMGYNRKAVNVDKLGFLNSTIRYFLHQDEDSIRDNKKLYDLNSIISNMPYEYLEDLINLEDDEINVDKLINICLECDGSKVSIMRRLGLKRYHKYRFEINDVLNYEYSLRIARDNERKRRNDEMMKELPF